MTSLTKQRVRLNMKLLGQFSSQSGGPMIKEDKPTYREQFVPPEMSMISYFLMKVNLIEYQAIKFSLLKEYFSVKTFNYLLVFKALQVLITCLKPYVSFSLVSSEILASRSIIYEVLP